MFIKKMAERDHHWSGPSVQLLRVIHRQRRHRVLGRAQDQLHVHLHQDCYQGHLSFCFLKTLEIHNIKMMFLEQVCLRSLISFSISTNEFSI